MKNLIITTFVLGLSSTAFANNENLDEIYSTAFSNDDIETTSSQPQVGSSRDSNGISMMDDGRDFSWYDIKDGN